MAKLYGEIGASALMTFDKSFSRSNGQPLDSTEVFYSKSAAETYAAGEVAYIGQKIVVVETVGEVTKVTHYGIEPDNSLKELGSSPVGDKSTIVVAEDGTVSLAGVAGLEFTEQNEDGEEVAVTYQPLLTSAGLTWVKPSATTVEGLATEIENLKARAGALETTVGDEGSGLVKDVADLKAVSHEHENADVLNDISTEKVSAWDAAEANAKQHATDLNTAMDTRVKAIEDDHLKAADKTELTEAIATAKSEAIEEAVATVLGEGVSEDFDTLKEVADWILSDTTGAAALITRVSNIEKDYLKGADKEELQGEIDALSQFVGDLPEGSTSATVVAYIQEVVDGLKIGDYAKAEALTNLEARVKALEDVGAEKNVINSADETYFSVDENRQLSLKDIEISKVVGLQEALEDKAAKGTTLAEYGITDAYTKTETEGRIQEVLDGLSDTSETAASVSQALETYKTSNDQRVDAIEDKLTTVEEGAQVNVVDGVSEEFEISEDEKVLSVKAIAQEKVTGLPDALAAKLSGVKVGETALEVVDGVVTIPGALQASLGLVKGTDAENGITINDDHTMTVNSVNVNKLVQTQGEYLVLDGGGAATVASAT